MKLFSFALLLAALCCAADVDAKCGGASARRAARMERRQGSMMFYSRSVTYMRAAPACGSCAPSQAPPMAKKLPK